jgi:hypothetical protein
MATRETIRRLDDRCGGLSSWSCASNLARCSRAAVQGDVLSPLQGERISVLWTGRKHLLSISLDLLAPPIMGRTLGAIRSF